MVFDMTSSLSALNSLSKLLELQEDVIQSFIDENIEYDGVCIESTFTADGLLDKAGLTSDSLDITNITLMILHYTSTNDNCQTLKTLGIRDLQYVLANKTPLSNFLSAKGVTFDIRNNIMVAFGKNYDIKYCIKRSQDDALKDISRKVYYDYATSAFFFIDDVTKYSGRVHTRPEFLVDLESFDSRLNGISDEWANKNKKYEIKIAAPLSILDDCVWKTDGFVKWLIRCALPIAGHITDCSFAHIKRGSHVDPHHIVGIREISAGNADT